LSIAVATVALASVIESAFANPPEDIHAIDIVGLHLGQAPDEAVAIAKNDIKEARFDVYAGPMQLGEFTTEPITFGAQIMGPGNEQMIQLQFSTEPNKGTVYITRREGFESRGQDILMDTLKQSLIDKYGKPTYETVGGFKTNPVDYELVWAFDTKVSTTPGTEPEFGSPAARCADFLMENEPAAALTGKLSDIAGGKDCGVWMKVQIYPNNKDKALAGNMLVMLADFRGISESYDYIMGILQKGAEDAAAALHKKASDNKPQL
jgi:hypothetical protein